MGTSADPPRESGPAWGGPALGPGVYLDHNATTRPPVEVVRAMVDAMQSTWANPSSTHEPGQGARRALADARQRVAAFIGCQASELVFTSGATEANHMAVLGALSAARSAGRHRLVVSAVEHAGLLALAERLRSEGTPLDLIPVDRQGCLDLARARALIGPDVALVSVMGANNETGVVMPTTELAALAHAQGAWLHVDATQLVGKAPFSFAGCGADLVSLSAHKLGGPKGIGALVVRKGVGLPALICGRQERHRRGGTENMPGIAGFAAACDLAAASEAADIARMTALRERLEAGLLAATPGLHVHAQGAPRLSNTLCVRFGDLDAEAVLNRLERAGVVASSGAACSAGGTQPSHVLLAMGESPAQAKGGVRFSLGRDTQAADIDRTLDAVRRTVAPLLHPTALAA
jgi:cysteine desulfurase